MVSVAVALTLADRSSWGFLFTYCAGCAALLPSSLAFSSLVLSTVLAVGVSALGGAGGGTAISFGASTAGVGLLMMLLRDVRQRNIELSSARRELARLAVAEERERFSRDLHDLLGQSLSVIALKAELAGRLLPDRPDEAAGEVAELGQVARTALGEVRDAVSGYRQPTLDRELAGARMALSAAGIESEVRKSSVSLEPDVEAVLAWAVREGATNVIRHSSAHRCTLQVNASLTDAGVEVIDDGVGAALNGNGNRDGVGAGDAAAAGGHGLAGLAERARPLNGTIEAGGLAGGGYRLAVTVPVARA
jgi:two-component system sensor histidine kinase DesK